jgi:hypothetical protein
MPWYFKLVRLVLTEKWLGNILISGLSAAKLSYGRNQHPRRSVGFSFRNGTKLHCFTAHWNGKIFATITGLLKRRSSLPNFACQKSVRTIAKALGKTPEYICMKVAR